MALHNETGKWGEQLACEYLMHEGYRIVERDWKCGKRDIDIVAIENDVYVFVEVKTRRNYALFPLLLTHTLKVIISTENYVSIL